MKDLLKMSMVGIATAVLAATAPMKTVPHTDRGVVPDTVEPYSEDMTWMGSSCSNVVDCALTSRDFCRSHGGAASVEYNGRDTSDWSCEVRCVDETIGHLSCLDATLPPIGRTGDTTPTEKEEPAPDCSPDLVGPPHPDCPPADECTGEACA